VRDSYLATKLRDPNLRQTETDGKLLSIDWQQSVSPSVRPSVCLEVGLGAWRLTFDPRDDGASRAEDVHRVEALVFADDGLEDAQQLPEALVDGLVQAALVL